MGRLIAPFIYMALIFLLSSIPGDNPNSDNFFEKSLIWIQPNLQNLLHLPLFFGLALAWVYCLKQHIKSHYLHLITAFFFSASYGLLDELHQIEILGRYGSISDAMLDALGASLIFFIPLLHKTRAKIAPT